MKEKQEPKDEDKFHSKGHKGHKGKTLESLFAAFAVKYLSVNSVSLW
jgi:hypothetical protein